MEKDKFGIPIFMTLSYKVFERWLKEYNTKKWESQYGSLSPEDREILEFNHCRVQWQKVYQKAGDYNIE